MKYKNLIELIFRVTTRIHAHNTNGFRGGGRGERTTRRTKTFSRGGYFDNNEVEVAFECFQVPVARTDSSHVVCFFDWKFHPKRDRYREGKRSRSFKKCTKNDLLLRVVLPIRTQSDVSVRTTPWFPLLHVGRILRVGETKQNERRD